MLKKWQMQKLESLQGWKEFLVSYTPTEYAFSKKIRLLQMMKNGEPRPSSKTKLGASFFDYINPKNKQYDPKFVENVAILQPKWLLTTKTKKYYVELAENLAKDNGGLLPNTTWLIKNGYNGLYQQMLKHPEWFCHIERAENSRKQLHEWLKIAEKLAFENDGLLPNTTWLIKNGYRGLYQFTMSKPELFAHIDKEVRTISLDMWVIEAENLAEQNNGTLPNIKRLRSMKPTVKSLKVKTYSGLIHMMKKYPNSFSHIQQVKLLKQPQEWVETAENLANQNNGVLPHPKKLRNMGHSGLWMAIKQNPEIFSHINQHKVQKPLKDWVKIAEQLAVDNNGVLPSSLWLTKNGYSRINVLTRTNKEAFSHIKRTFLNGESIESRVAEAELILNKHGKLSLSMLTKSGNTALHSAIMRYPEKFSHIKIEKQSRPPEYWVPIAEQLSIEYGGNLPNRTWLEKNGYIALASAMYRHPEIFSHINKIKGRCNA